MNDQGPDNFGKNDLHVQLSFPMPILALLIYSLLPIGFVNFFWESNMRYDFHCRGFGNSSYCISKVGDVDVDPSVI